MKVIILIAIILLILYIWIVSTRRELSAMDENIDRAMSQLGVQLSSRFDALFSLLELSRRYAAPEARAIIEAIKPRRSVITARSAPSDALKQESIISEAMNRICVMAAQHPDFTADENYAPYTDAVKRFEESVRADRLIYNDCVAKRNRAIRLFPTNMIAGMLGFHQRPHMETVGGEETDRIT